MPSPFRRLLLTDWYDGPLSGLAIDESGGVYTFQFLDWDDRHQMRVFRFSAAPDTRASDVESAFAFSREDDWSSWVLPPSLPAPAEELLKLVERSARPVAVVAATDLLVRIEIWKSVTDLTCEPASQGWLEALGLPRTAGDR